MDYLAIERLIKIVNDSDLKDFEIEESGLKIRMSKNSYESKSNANNDAITNVDSNDITENNKPIFKENINLDNNENVKESVKEEINLDDCYIVKSPMVGTFYAAPSEDSNPYVSVGDKVSKGDILCIIEAMKLMNEIECERDGIIAEILVANGDIVEYGQPILAIK